MAVYNTEFVLVQRAIESLFRQDFEDYELLIMNDGSRDELNVPLKKYIEQFPDKIKYFYHENSGFPKTLNSGIENSIGKYISFLDSDDEYKSNHL